MVLAYGLAGFSNFFLRRPFVSDAVLALLVLVTLAAFVDFSVHPADADRGRAGAGGLAAGAGGNFGAVRVVGSGGAGAGVFDAAGHDSHPGGLLGVFFDRADVGLSFGQRGGTAANWWASTLYTVIPNWQLFWLADALSMGKNTFHWAYVGKAFVYAVAYAGAALAVGTALFEERELG